MFIDLYSIFVDIFCDLIYDYRIPPREVAHARKNCQSLSHFTGTKGDQTAAKYRSDGRAARDGRCLVYAEFLANNQLPRYDAPVIMALCEYFDCQVGDLLVFEREDNFHISEKA